MTPVRKTVFLMVEVIIFANEAFQCMIGRQYYRMASGLLKCLIRMVRACDMFSNTQFLRYNENPQHKSASGGLVSITVMLAFFTIFTQTILNTFKKTYITSSTTQYEESEPTFFSTDKTPFLFAVGATGFNLTNSTHKYFNVELYQRSVINKTKYTTYFDLVPCEKSVWVELDPSIGPTFDRLGLSSWLCLSQNYSFEFEGKFSSDIFKYLKISLKSCKIVAGDNRTCVPDSQIDSYLAKNGPISFNYYFINTVINPDNAQYISYYLEDRNYFQFTRSLGTTANVFISSFTISTDQSLWPWQTYQEDLGGIVYQPTQRYVFNPLADSKNQTEYISLFLRKSSLSLSVMRSFRKYDDTLSYIGGLFSTFMVALFIMHTYNEYGFEVDIAAKIYKHRKKAPIPRSKFHLFSFVGYGFFLLLELIGLSPRWKTMKQFDQARQEIGKQLDVAFLMRKISFMEDCLNFLLEDFQIECLHLKGKLTLPEAKTARMKFSSRRELMKLKRRYEEDRKNQEKAQVGVSSNEVTNIFEPGKSFKTGDHPDELHNQVQVTTILHPPQNADSSSQSDQDQNDSPEKGKDLMGYICSISELQRQALKGNKRCGKIYKSLDKVIKDLPSLIKIQENVQTKQVNSNKLEFEETRQNELLLQTFNFT